MRYWHPFSDETARAVRDWEPDEVVLLPLYPQYSTTTTGSSLTAWREAAARAGWSRDTTVLCCYPTDAGYVAATAASAARRMATARRAACDRRSGCGCCSPRMACRKRSCKAGDPYQWQIEQTVAPCWRPGTQAVDSVDLLPVPRDAAAMDRPQHRGGDRAGGA